MPEAATQIVTLWSFVTAFDITFSYTVCNRSWLRMIEVEWKEEAVIYFKVSSLYVGAELEENHESV